MSRYPLSMYRTATHNLGLDFFRASLETATEYLRGVGFFSSSVFSVGASTFQGFFSRGGTYRIVSSPVFSEDDVEAMRRAHFERQAVLDEGKRMGGMLWRRSGPLLFAYLIATAAVRIRVALPDSDVRDGIYHEKIGMFRYAGGRYVAFTGSANESVTAWQRNFERVDVFCSWAEQTERSRARAIERDVRNLWNGDTSRLRVVDLQEAFLGDLLRQRPSSGVYHDGDERGQASVRVLAVPPESLIPNPEITLFSHQKGAIAAWAGASGRGLLEMATGSGKTITALSLASRLYDSLGQSLFILIVAPYIHLVDQWIDNARGFGLRPTRCAEGHTNWRDEMATGIRALNAGRRPVMSVVATAATLASEPFRDLLLRVRQPMLVIGDEAHNYGSPVIAGALPTNAAFRLGLSATPDRWMDEVGTNRIREYFGEVVFRYGLGDALRDGVLAPYAYFPVLIDLAPDEIDEYLDLTRQLAKYLHGDLDTAPSSAAKFLLLKRARLIASAKGKLPALGALLRKGVGDTHILVYCGDGEVEGPEAESLSRQVDAVVQLVGSDLGMVCASYTARTPSKRRQELLSAFANGDLQALVAIRCLDEGVDVPATKTAYFLASSTNPRQYVQRRGRVMRVAPGKRRSEIFDFFVSPPLDDVEPGSDEYRVMRRLFGNQLRRAREFAELAENGPQARRELMESARHFGVLSEWEVH